MDFLFQCLGSEATKPPGICWGRLSLLHAGGSWEGDDSFLVPVATPRELLVTRWAPPGEQQHLQGSSAADKPRG